MHKHIKKWGQVFLRDKNIQKKISEFINSLNYECMVEIGPGEGALTQFINFENKEFYVVELDKKLASCLINKYLNLKVIQGDFLKIEIPLNKKSLLFGNIPYYITSSIIFKFLKSEAFIESVFMIQKECFESFVCSPSNKKYSSFSVLLQSILEIRKIMDVKRVNFYPIPKVDSVVVSFKKKENSMLLCLLEEYSLFLKKSFFMPRKTLKNNLKKFLGNEQIEEIFIENKLIENIRPDAISPKKYEDIFLSFSGKKYLHNML